MFLRLPSLETCYYSDDWFLVLEFLIQALLDAQLDYIENSLKPKQVSTAVKFFPDLNN